MVAIVYMFPCQSLPFFNYPIDDYLYGSRKIIHSFNYSKIHVVVRVVISNHLCQQYRALHRTSYQMWLDGQTDTCVTYPRPPVNFYPYDPHYPTYIHINHKTNTRYFRSFHIFLFNRKQCGWKENFLNLTILNDQNRDMHKISRHQEQGYVCKCKQSTFTQRPIFFFHL